MTVTREEMRKIRLELVHQMHDYIMNIGDEDIYDVWMTECIPDEPCEDDFEWFANDTNEFKEICAVFGRLVHIDETENY